MIDVNDFDKGKNIKRELKNFSPYVDKSHLYRLKYQTLPEDDDEGTYRTHRFTLKCKSAEFKFKPLLKALCNQDLGLKPSIHHQVYIININKNDLSCLR